MTQKEVVFFPYFEKMILLIFAGNDLKKRYCFLSYCTNPISGKIVPLEL